jgi:predicted transglutaminase-like cysteine proteinase
MSTFVKNDAMLSLVLKIYGLFIAHLHAQYYSFITTLNNFSQSAHFFTFCVLEQSECMI